MLKRHLHNLRLRLLLKRLAAQGFSPKHLELTEVGSWFFGSAYNETQVHTISESVATGLAQDPALALTKAIVEMIERQAFDLGRKNGLPACQTARSDGFAAYPTTFSSLKKASRLARNNALMEARERYVWANWWDDPSVGHRVVDDLPAAGLAIPKELLEALETHSPVTSIKAIFPFVRQSGFSLIILVLELEDGGIVTGGACGESGEENHFIVRAYAELYRHAQALIRLKKLDDDNRLTFYERRLKFFGFGQGKQLVMQRLSCIGTMAVDLPQLKIDTQVPHKHDSRVVVYRCLFEGQPTFIGGEVERLCI